MKQTEKMVRLGSPNQKKSIDEILKELGLNSGGPSNWGWSWWKRFLACPYDGKLIQLQGHNGGNSPALVYGILAHAALANYYLAAKVAGAGSYLPAEIMRVPTEVMGWCAKQIEKGEDYSALWHITSEVLSMCRAYAVRYPTTGVYVHDFIERNPAPHSIVLVEEVLEVYEPFPYSARIDLAYLGQLGGDDQVVAVLLDHKTTSDPNIYNEFWQSGQMLGIMYLWQRVMEPKGYPPVSFFAINGIEKGRGPQPPQFTRKLFPMREGRIGLWVQSMKAAYNDYVKSQARYSLNRSQEIPGTEMQDLLNSFPQRWSGCLDRRYNRGVCERLEQCMYLVVSEPVDNDTTFPSVPERAECWVPLDISDQVHEPANNAPCSQPSLFDKPVQPANPTQVDNPLSSFSEDSNQPCPVEPEEDEPSFFNVEQRGLINSLEHALIAFPERLKQSREGVLWLSTASREEIQEVGRKQLGDKCPVLNHKNELITALLQHWVTLSDQHIPDQTRSDQISRFLIDKKAQLHLDKLPAEQAIPASSVVPGRFYYHAGFVGLAIDPSFAGYTCPPQGEVAFYQPGSRYHTIRDSEKVIPCSFHFIDEKTAPSKKPQADSPDPIGVQWGEYSRPTGMVPIYWMGCWIRGGKKLARRLEDLTEIPGAIGIALTGKEPSKRTMKAFTLLPGEGALFGVETTKTALGEEGWNHLAGVLREHADEIEG